MHLCAIELLRGDHVDLRWFVPSNSSHTLPLQVPCGRNTTWKAPKPPEDKLPTPTRQVLRIQTVCNLPTYCSSHTWLSICLGMVYCRSSLQLLLQCQMCMKSCTCWEAAKELPKIVRPPRFWYGFVKVASCEGLGVCWGGYMEIRRHLCCCGKANFENLEEKLREFLGGFYRNGSTSTSCLNHSFWDVRLFQTGKMQRTLSWRSSWKSWRATNGSRFCRSDIALLRFCNVLATQRGNTQGFRRLKTYCITLLWYCIHLYPNRRPIFGSKKILGKSDSCHPSVHWSIDPTRREKNALQEQPRLQQILVIDGSMTPMDSHGVPGGCWLLPVD